MAPCTPPTTRSPPIRALSGNSTPLDGTDFYVMSDQSDQGVVGLRNSTTLIDDILGQASAATADFVAISHGAGAPPALIGNNDLISNNSPGVGHGFPGTDLISGNPLLGDLADHGGPTETMALLAGSPALGVGVTAYYDYPNLASPITVDQRGLSRPSAPALGSFQPVTTSYAVTDSGDGNGSDNDVTLRYAIDQAVTYDETATIGFDPSLADATITLGTVDTTAANVYGNTAFVIDGASITIDGSAAPGLVISGNDNVAAVRGDEHGFADAEESDGRGWEGAGVRGGRQRRWRRRWRRRGNGGGGV